MKEKVKVWWPIIISFVLLVMVAGMMVFLLVSGPTFEGESVDQQSVSAQVVAETTTTTTTTTRVVSEGLEPEYRLDPIVRDDMSVEECTGRMADCLSDEWYEFYGAVRGTPEADALVTRFFGDECINRGVEYVNPGEGCFP